MSEREPSHHERALRLLRNLSENPSTTGFQVEHVRVSTALDGQATIRLRYVDARLGQRTDEIILFADGTWRFHTI